MQSAESSSSSAAAAAAAQSDVSLPHEDNGVQDVVDHFFQPVKVIILFLFLYPPKFQTFVPSVLWMNFLFFFCSLHWGRLLDRSLVKEGR